MEPILIIIIILIISAVRNALNKSKTQKRRSESFPKPAEGPSEPREKDTGRKGEVFPGWPGQESFPAMPGRGGEAAEKDKPFYGERRRETASHWPGAAEKDEGTEKEDVFIDDKISEYRDKKPKRKDKKSSALYTSKKRYSTYRKQKPKSRWRVQDVLKDRNDLKKGILLKEVLGKPKSHEIMAKHNRFK